MTDSKSSPNLDATVEKLAHEAIDALGGGSDVTQEQITAWVWAHRREEIEPFAIELAQKGMILEVDELRDQKAEAAEKYRLHQAQKLIDEYSAGKKE